MQIDPKNVKLILAFLFCVALSTCTKATTLPSPTWTALLTDTRTPDALTSTNTVTLRPPFTLTATRQPSLTPTRTQPPPTSTRRPSLTPTIRPPTKTVPVDAQAMMTQLAMDIRKTQIASFPANCKASEQDKTSLSPNGNWLAIACGHESNQALEIIGKEGQHWTLLFKDYLAEEDMIGGGTPRGNLHPARWTNDEKFLFFTAYIAVDGDDLCFYPKGIKGLYRIELETGNVSTTLPTLSSPDGYEITFSPGGRMLAYNTGSAIIRDLRSGEEVKIETSGDEVGNLSWSPDGSELAYATCHVDVNNLMVEKSSVKIYSLETRVSRTILAVDNALLRIELLDENKLLRIATDDFQSGKTTYQFYDWSSERFITPTPKPSQ